MTDDDRNRFGALLDKAAQRGLLSAADYEVRLRDLAVATTTEEMMAIVTDLPAFAVPAAATPTGRRGMAAGNKRDARTAAAIGGATRSSHRTDGSSPWLMLVVLIVAVWRSRSWSWP